MCSWNNKLHIILISVMERNIMVTKFIVFQIDSASIQSNQFIWWEPHLQDDP